MTKRLNAAATLIDGLTGERTRWTVEVGNLEEKGVRLYGDCLLGSSFLSYAGAFTADYRKELIYDKFLNYQTVTLDDGLPELPKYTLNYGLNPLKEYRVNYNIVSSHIIQDIDVYPHQTAARTELNKSECNASTIH